MRNQSQADVPQEHESVSKVGHLFCYKILLECNLKQSSFSGLCLPAEVSWTDKDEGREPQSRKTANLQDMTDFTNCKAFLTALPLVLSSLLTSPVGLADLISRGNEALRHVQSMQCDFDNVVRR